MESLLRQYVYVPSRIWHNQPFSRAACHFRPSMQLSKLYVSCYRWNASICSSIFLTSSTIMAPRADTTQQAMPQDSFEASTIVSNLVSRYYQYHINKLRHDPPPSSAPIAETWIPIWLVGQCNHAGKILAQAVSAYCKREMACVMHYPDVIHSFQHPLPGT